jgi:hypothetical protein
MLRFGVGQRQSAVLAGHLQVGVTEHRLHAKDVGAVPEHLHAKERRRA